MRLSKVQKKVLQVSASTIVLAMTAWIMVDVPKLTGSTWHDIRHNLAQIHFLTVLAIAALWIGGLIVYTIAMTRACPA